MLTFKREGAAMQDYEIIDTNADNIDGCNLCGNKAASNLGRRRKADWLKMRYAEGLRFKALRSRQTGDIGMIEYVPGNQAWRPVTAEGFFVIHCLMVGRQHAGKGLGAVLLDACISDAKRCQCRGVAVVTSPDGFMAENKLFIKAGFRPVARIIGGSAASVAPYDLLAMKFKKTAPDPRFCVERERLLIQHGKGLTLLCADQCPYLIQSVERIVAAAKTLGLAPKVVRLVTAKASRELPTPYGVFSIIYDGKLIAHRPISATRFLNIMTSRRP